MGVFITFEGVDGAGKSTQLGVLAETLRKQGHAVTTTREPGGAPGAEEIRRLLVEGDPDRWSAETELLLFTAARRDHVERTIRPALDRGDFVLCDRFVDSTRAYQGEQALRDKIDTLHDLMIGLTPDLTLIFDIDPARALDRATSRGGGEDRFEQKGLAFQQVLRDRFLAIAAAEPERCRVIDADRTAAEIGADVLAQMQTQMQTRLQAGLGQT